MINSSLRLLAAGTLAAVVSAPYAQGQGGFYNLDAGRPTRVEDALPTSLGELELQFLPLRADWLGDGSSRQRFEPKVSYGVLRLTEIEVRMPVVRSQSPNANVTTGVASAAIGALHAFNIETSWPALALAAEVVLPVGSLSAPTPSYSVKALMTKTFAFGRLQLNAGGGSWSIRLPLQGPVAVPNQCGDPGLPPCLPPDLPCTIVPLADAGGAPSMACLPATIASGARAAAVGRRSTGAHWTVALGIDHTWPLISTLVVADIIVDRFEGLFPLNDWTAELGLRRQLTPQLVGDIGISRRFAGITQSTGITAGATFAMPFRW